MEIIHTLRGGPILHLTAQRRCRFEDHPYCGPVLVDRCGTPTAEQPGDLDTFWLHYEAWARQGKRTRVHGDKAWCVYETDMQAARRRHAEARSKDQPHDH